MFAWLDKFTDRRASRPQAEAAKLLKQGNDHVLRAAWDAATTCYRQALSIDAGYVEALIGLGFVLIEQRAYREAEQHLKHALSLNPQIADAYYLLGKLYQERDEESLDAAIDQFTKALQIQPDFELVYKSLYVALARSGQTERAKGLLREAIVDFPESAEFQTNLGNLLSNEGSPGDAIKCYEAALANEPNWADLHHLLGLAQSKRGDLGAAATSFRKASALNPDLAASYLELGIVLGRQDKIDEAIAKFKHAVAREPELAIAHQHLGNAYLQKGATKDAIACFREVVRLQPSGGVAHLIEALSGTNSERAPDEYVEKLFDGYAERFDSHLVQALKYSVPEQLVEILKAYSEPGGPKWDVLDLGCGTGLAGVVIAPYARQLVGVDLSSKMLEKAVARSLYQRLERSDLVAMMKLEVANSYDVAIAADVLVYLGRLEELVGQVRRILRPGGLFAFSAESLDAVGEISSVADARPDFRLGVTGRYAHSADYLQGLALGQRFDVLQMKHTQGRVDKGQAVQHYLALWRVATEGRTDHHPDPGV